MRVLLTGFEPFGGSAINPSEQVVQALSSSPINGLEIYPAVLPVDYQAGPRTLLAALEEIKPQAVLCLGEAARRAVVSVERVAVNLLDFSIPDNAGAQMVDQPIITAGPAAYFATLPVRKIVHNIRAAGVPVELSLSAGSYLCNQVLYTLLHQLNIQGLSKTPAGFIHLPSLPEQTAQQKSAAPSMALETSLRAVRAALETLLEKDEVNP